MRRVIVADIGGTNARFALVGVQKGETIELSDIKTFKGEDYASFDVAFEQYRSGVGEVDAASIAIASPINGDAIAMTNLPWAFSIEQMREQLGLDQFYVINDFHAVALGVPQVVHEAGNGQASLVEIKPGNRDPYGNHAVLGAGTGLGVAGLTYSRPEKRWLAIAGVGGHVNLAPTNVDEVALIQAAIKTFGHVSAETFLCGSGLVNLYETLCSVAGEHAQTLTPEQVTAHAIQKTDASCEKALTVFWELLATVAGNVALTFGATGGVYIAGGIVPHFIERFDANAFGARFEAKGVMQDFVAGIPVSIVTDPHIGLKGAGRYFLDQVS